MSLPFTKMHGLGNDFVLIATGGRTITQAAQFAIRICDRRHGVGADGLLLLDPVVFGEATVRMTIYNADGSRAEACGNGLRCAAKYTYEHGLARRNPLAIVTDAGVLSLDLSVNDDGQVEAVCANMGSPILDPRHIPVRMTGEHVISRLLEAAGRQFAITCVSMGNPHVVIFQRDLADIPLAEWGPTISQHALFPEGANVHFARVLSRDHVQMLTWERGVGATGACGTGACAVCVAGVLNHLLDRRATVQPPGGTLKVEWNEVTDEVYMTGPATEVFAGTWPES